MNVDRSWLDRTRDRSLLDDDLLWLSSHCDRSWGIHKDISTRIGTGIFRIINPMLISDNLRGGCWWRRWKRGLVSILVHGEVRFVSFVVDSEEGLLRVHLAYFISD